MYGDLILERYTFFKYSFMKRCVSTLISKKVIKYRIFYLFDETDSFIVIEI